MRAPSISRSSARFQGYYDITFKTPEGAILRDPKIMGTIRLHAQTREGHSFVSALQGKLNAGSLAVDPFLDRFMLRSDDPQGKQLTLEREYGAIFAARVVLGSVLQDINQGKIQSLQELPQALAPAIRYLDRYKE